MRRRLLPMGRPIPVLCLSGFAVVWGLLAIAPVYRDDWLLENLLTFVALPAWLLAARRVPLSDRAWVQATLFAVLHTVGSHYTYSEVPIGFWARDVFGLSRNHYDRFVHFAFGLLILRPVRELTIRDPRAFGAFGLAYLCISGIVVWSALYEISEWVVAILVDPAAGTAYLGTQGDQWDAQKDMACAFVGALMAATVEAARDRRDRRRAAG